MKKTTKDERMALLKKRARIMALERNWAKEVRDLFGDGTGEHSQCCPLGAPAGLSGGSGYDPCACGARQDDMQEAMALAGNALVCAQCGGSSVKLQCWVDANTDEVFDEALDTDDGTWCADCEDHTGFVTVAEWQKKTTKPADKYEVEREFQNGAGRQ